MIAFSDACGGKIREKRRQAPELLALPACERVIVALGTFEPDSEENPRHPRRDILGFALLGRVIASGRGIDPRRVQPRVGVATLATRAVRISRTMRS